VSRASIVGFLALVLASCTSAVQGDAGLVDDRALDAPSAPSVELGTGLEAFVPIPDEGAELELVHGPQGGWHVHLSLRVRGFVPTGLIYEITRLSDGELVCMLPLGVREGTFVERDGALERVGDFAIFSITSPEEIVGQDVLVRASLYDAERRSVMDEVRARIVDLAP
jgi:hypothetical protein